MIDIKTSKKIFSMNKGINLLIDVDGVKNQYFIVLEEPKNLFPYIKKYEDKFFVYIQDVVEFTIAPDKKHKKSLFKFEYYYTKKEDSIYFIAKLDLEQKLFSSEIYVYYNKRILERYFVFNEKELSQKEIDSIPSEFKNIETKNKEKLANELFFLCKKHEVKNEHISTSRNTLARYVENVMDSHFGINKWAWEIFLITKGSQDVGSFCAPVLVKEISKSC